MTLYALDGGLSHRPRRKPLPWTSNDLVLLVEHLRNGDGIAFIAQRLQRTENSVLHQLRRMLPPSLQHCPHLVLFAAAWRILSNPDYNWQAARTTRLPATIRPAPVTAISPATAISAAASHPAATRPAATTTTAANTRSAASSQDVVTSLGEHAELGSAQVDNQPHDGRPHAASLPQNTHGGVRRHHMHRVRKAVQYRPTPFPLWHHLRA